MTELGINGKKFWIDYEEWKTLKKFYNGEPMKSKYYMFRDLEHRDNLQDGRTFHAAGIVHEIVSTDSYSGKDIAVEYLDPFTLNMIYTWRATKEVELFEVPQYLFENYIDFINNIRNGK